MQLSLTSTLMIPAHGGDLLPLLRHAVPSVRCYRPLSNIEQANAAGMRVSVLHVDGGDGDGDGDGDGKSLPSELFVKLVDASYYAPSKKSWPDLRRTLLYSRTEARFYGEILPVLEGSGTALAPACYLAWSNLTNLVGEDEVASVTASCPPSGNEGEAVAPSLLQGRGGALILASLCPDRYYQRSPTSPAQASVCLAAAARLHAAGWEDRELLLRTADRLGPKAGSYHLDVRNPKELANLVATWEAFVSAFRGQDEALFRKEGVADLGWRVFRSARRVSDALSPRPDGDYATVVHGDYKAMNVFLPTEDDNEDGDDGGRQGLMIDFASTGVGLGASDVAMLLTHGVTADDLSDGGEEGLLEGYLVALDGELRQRDRGGGIGLGQQRRYPRDVAMRHYKLATIDSFRFVLGRFWKGATPESFEKKKDSPNTTLVNRNIDAALAFVRRADGYLAEFEEEWGLP